jgi:hypothetical protein
MAMTSSAATRPSGFFIWHEPSSAVARRVPQGALIAALIMSVLGQRATGREALFELKRCSRGAKSRFFVDFFTYRGRNMRIYLFCDESQSEIFAFLSDVTGEEDRNRHAAHRVNFPCGD